MVPVDRDTAVVVGQDATHDARAEMARGLVFDRVRRIFPGGMVRR
jgi:hypothetical protein